jgi:DNA mismatch repair protein MutL
MKIKLLRDDVINQIAAGEVIDRPYSVIRELLDNSIDAKATEVSVFIEEGGQKLIRVVDNGEGMQRDDALLAFERHATSKISTASDLLNINTYGFRGEALSSIASVTNLNLKTRTKDNTLATEVNIKGGKIISVEQTSGNFGTEFLISNLFFNVPARKKFLKSVSSEERKIKQWFVQYTIANPNIHFKLYINNKLVVNSPAVENSLARARTLLKGNTIEVNKHVLGEVKLEGLLGHPALAQFDSSGCVVIVNGRLVSDKIIIRAVKDGFGSYLKDREYPIGFISLQISPSLVDINVHPQKSEVRFRNEREIFLAVMNSVKEALSGLNTPMPSSYMTQPPSYNNPYNSSLTPNHYFPSVISEESKDYSYAKNTSATNLLLNFNSLTEKIEEDSNFKFSDLKYIGQLFKCYLLCSFQNSFIVVDMHAAHERVSYNKIRNLIKSRKVISQPLLLPISIELSEKAIDNILENSEILSDFGFEIDRIGINNVIIRAIPNYYIDQEVLSFFKEIASYDDSFSADGAVERKIDYIAARLACHASIRSGKELEKEEVYALFADLDSSDCRSACPHGRPIVVTFQESEIESWFGRDR